MVDSGTGHFPTEFWSSLESRVGFEDVRIWLQRSDGVVQVPERKHAAGYKRGLRSWQRCPGRLRYPSPAGHF